MEPVHYLRALRQWWWVIAASALIGMVLAVVASATSTTKYEATHDLLYSQSTVDEDGDDPAVTVPRLAFLATRGDVLNRVADERNENPAAIVPRLSVTADPDLQTVSITAKGTDARDTEQLADSVAAQLQASVADQATAARQAVIDQLRREVNQLNAELASTFAGDQREALNVRLTEAQGQLLELNAQAAPESGLSTVEPALATSSSEGGAGGITSLLVGGFVGMLVGVGLALMLTRFDTRIRTKEDGEQAFGLPVIAEIPLLSRTRRKHREVISIADSASPGAEAYRSLRTSLVFAPRVRWSLNESSERAHRRSGDPIEAQVAESRMSQTVLVVSPGPGEGKSTSVANLAVAFAESGKYVLVISGDLRRPMVDRYLGVEPGPGVSELLAADGGVELVDLVRATSVPNVRMIPSGETVSNPGELLSHHGAALLEQARNLADIVLVDSPPLLATDDASPLLPTIDDVLVVCRAGVTTAEAARRTSELLSRLGASVAGVALVGALSGPSVRGYYRTYATPKARPWARTVPDSITADPSGDRESRPAGAGGLSRSAGSSDTV